jgi:hypothetical protein
MSFKRLVIQTAKEAGLELTALREWTHANGCKLFETMIERPGRRWTLPDGVPTLPLIYGLVARRPG